MQWEQSTCDMPFKLFVLTLNAVILTMRRPQLMQSYRREMAVKWHQNSLAVYPSTKNCRKNGR